MSELEITGKLTVPVRITVDDISRKEVKLSANGIGNAASCKGPRLRKGDSTTLLVDIDFRSCYANKD